MIKSFIAAFLLIPGLTAPVRAQSSARLEKARKIWTSLSPEDRALVRDNYQRFKTMTAQEQALIRRRFKIFQSLPQKRQEELLEKWRVFRSLTPAQRQKLESLARARQRLGAKTPWRSGRGNHPEPPGAMHGPRDHGGAGHHR